VGQSCIKEVGGLVHIQAGQKYHDARRGYTDILREVLKFSNGGWNVSRGQTKKEGERDDTKESDSKGTV
jgi:hypothetical protein